jgi:hypothetical protein
MAEEKKPARNKTKKQIAFEIKEMAQEIRHLAHTNKKVGKAELLGAHLHLQHIRFLLMPEGKAETSEIVSILDWKK